MRSSRFWVAGTVHGEERASYPAHPMSPGWAAWLVPSLADVVFAALLGFALALRTHQLLNSDGDLARHLTVGRQILASGAVPLVDLFSHTRGGDAFVPYEWLSEVLMALTYQGLGLEGVALLSAVVAALPFLLLTRWMVRDGANPFVVLALVTVGALATSMHWLARPHIFTILLALLWTRALTRYRETGRLRYLVALPPLMALWANLHGGFLVGFVVLGVFLLAEVSRQLLAFSHEQAQGTGRRGDAETRRRGDAETRRQDGGLRTQHPGLSTQDSAFSTQHSALRTPMALAGAGFASLLAVGLNPVGYGVLPHVLGYFRSRLLVDNTVEYLSPNFHELGPQLFLGLVLVAVISLAATPRRIDTVDLGMLVVWTSLSLYSARNIPLFVVLCLPIVARLATGVVGRGDAGMWRRGDAEEAGLRTQDSGLEAGHVPIDPRPGPAHRLAATDRLLGRPLLPALIVAFALLVSLGALGDARPRAGFDPAVFPVEALRNTEAAGVQGKLFNYFPWGGYVLHAAYPRHQVFIDGQTDFYGEELMRDYLKVALLEPDWEVVLERHQIGWVLFPHQSPLSLILARSAGWRLAYEDTTSDIFVRTLTERD